MKKPFLITLLCTLLPSALPTVWAQNDAAMPVHRIAAKRLPDMGVPRVGHAVLFTQGGELTVMGGHTTGFVPVQTAEWFDGAAWHTVPMTYTHDHGTVLPLSSGKVLLAGGHEQPLGIGQTFTVETYDPATHTFSSYGCLDNKRCFASAAELDSGRVLISGTWYAKDGLELWDGSRANLHIKDVAAVRSVPCILRTYKDDAIVFGEEDEHAKRLANCALVDRLRGDAYEEPFLRTWHPVIGQTDYRSDACFVGDTLTGRYAYILPVMNDGGRFAFALVDGGRFSLLPSDYAVPVDYEGRVIHWFSRFVADRDRSRGYFMGYDDEQRLYVLRADYADALSADRGTLRLSLYVTDPLPALGVCTLAALSPSGDLVVAGGCPPNDNFNPTASVYRLPVGDGERAGAAASWLWCVVAGGVMLLAVALLIIYYIRKRKRARSVTAKDRDAVPAADADNPSDAQTFELMQGYLLEEQRYLSQGIHLSDVAAALGVSDRELSTSLRRQGYRSFPDLLNAMRIDYACELLRQNPAMKVRALTAASGFASESAFYSAFSSRTGQTPRQWASEHLPPR
ncbi:MAG: helix-turn-helix transcriptional regulator [Alloprevotella sp.]|nr:helix-turn-helix transcriptional regulator [Alloprevotella sp.]MBR1595014.1 helix-turn-helix transcriptional regulator [Alloprevotella sp.]MBR1652357.1 helix-turn-helix transcriptional regulator [Alloprevotella sp.]